MEKEKVVEKVTQMVEGEFQTVSYSRRKYIVKKASTYLYHIFRSDWRQVKQGSLVDVLEYMLREDY